jgi:hypothetical protein
VAAGRFRQFPHSAAHPSEGEPALSGALRAENESPVSTAAGFGNDPRVYYRFELDNGVVLAGRTDALGDLGSLILTPNTGYRAFYYAPATNRSTTNIGTSAASGGVSGFERAGAEIFLEQFGGPDANGDGIPEVGERTIGTDVRDLQRNRRIRERHDLAAVPSLGNIANDPLLAITDEQGLLDENGLALLDALPDNDLLVFTPDGSGGYQIVHNPLAGGAGR